VQLIVSVALFWQFSVVLQSEEEIVPGCRTLLKQGSALVSYTKYHEVCLSVKHSQFILPIPLHVTPGFTTDLGEFSRCPCLSFPTSSCFHFLYLVPSKRSLNLTLHFKSKIPHRIFQCQEFIAFMVLVVGSSHLKVSGTEQRRNINFCVRFEVVTAVTDECCLLGCYTVLLL
jgi:hypothetical protein